MVGNQKKQSKERRGSRSSLAVLAVLAVPAVLALFALAAFALAAIGREGRKSDVMLNGPDVAGSGSQLGIPVVGGGFGRMCGDESGLGERQRAESNDNIYTHIR